MKKWSEERKQAALDKRIAMVQTTAGRIYTSMVASNPKVARNRFSMQLRAETGCSEVIADIHYYRLTKR